MGFIVLCFCTATLHESSPAMADASCTPIITVSQDVYDAILLADRVMVVAEGKPKDALVTGGGLPDYFSLRQCFLSTSDAPAAILRLMVGG
jgi:ABC-type nitrate/sulfonate/bicarbonate transport system ATPase subunit